MSWNLHFFVKKYLGTQFLNIKSLLFNFNLFLYGNYLTSLPKKTGTREDESKFYLRDGNFIGLV